MHPLQNYEYAYDNIRLQSLIISLLKWQLLRCHMSDQYLVAQNKPYQRISAIVCYFIIYFPCRHSQMKMKKKENQDLLVKRTHFDCISVLYPISFVLAWHSEFVSFSYEQIKFIISAKASLLPNVHLLQQSLNTLEFYCKIAKKKHSKKPTQTQRNRSDLAGVRLYIF